MPSAMIRTIRRRCCPLLPSSHCLLSRPLNEESTFTRSMFSEKLRRLNDCAKRGLVVIELKSGNARHAAIGGVAEDFPRRRGIGRSRAPMALGVKSDGIRRVIPLARPAYVLIAPS